MGATLEALHRLQEVERQIAEVRQKIERKRRAVKAQERRLAEFDANIRNKEAALRTDQMEADRLNLDVKAAEAQIAKLRLALNAAKTNKEYSAVLTQLNTTKADNSKIEEKALTLMNQVEAKSRELNTLREERAAEAAKLKELEAACRQVEDATRATLERLAQDRALAEEHVPAQALDAFNRIARKNDGEALAGVIRTHPKREEYACESCNMTVTLEQVNAILSRDDPVLCNTCGCILYVDVAAPTRTR